MKRFLQISVGLVAAILVGLAIWLKTPAPEKFDRAAALKAAETYDARIIRDAYGVPHIYGARDADVAFGLAYAHAEDDIDNIQEGRRLSRGQMALKTGREGAITDYLVAAMQAERAAREKYTSDISPDTRALLEGYAAGINLYCAEDVDHCEKGFAPVTAVDLVTSFAARTPFFYGLDRELTKLFDGDIEMMERVTDAREAYLKLDRRLKPGSNGIAVAPSRSTDGHTRLSVNSHQPFIGPVAWYEARLKSDEGWDMIGGLFPGTPLISVGTNPHLGWAMTVNEPDLVDFYKLTVDDAENPRRYMMDGEWQDFEQEEITIRVKLWGPFSFPSKQIIRRSVHGPVFETPTGFVAVAFGGDRNIKGVEQWYRMNKAKTHEEWLQAMQLQGIPSFNIIYADKTGNIAHYHNAVIPVRAAGFDWSRIAPGDRSDLVWQGTRPFDAIPFVENPASGYVVNSNHTPFKSTADEDNPNPEDFPPHFGIRQKTTNRGLRAQALYGGDDQISEEEFLRYKMDNIYSEDSRLMIFLRQLQSNPDIAGKPEFETALALIASWDGRTDTDSRAAGLAIRTGQIAKGLQINGDGAENEDPVEALRQAIAEYMQGFGRIDPEWGEVNRLQRGDVDLPLNGAPDVLRAIYSVDNPSDGPLNAIAGDSYILYTSWDQNGAQTVRTIHQYGAATLDETSPHFADQTNLFANETYKAPPLELEDLLLEATADYRPGK